MTGTTRNPHVDRDTHDTHDTAPVADWVTIPDLYADPFPIFARLRAEGGVHWVPAVNRYLVTSYAAVHATEMDQEVFSANEEGSLQIRAMGHSMLRRDDPEHQIERKAWQQSLKPGVVTSVWKDVFERNAHRLIDGMIARGEDVDLIRDFAAPFAAENLKAMLGLNNTDHADLQRWSQALIDATGNYADDPEVWARGEAAFDEVDAALDEMLAWYSEHEDSSLLSMLLRYPGYEMPLEKIRANIKMSIGGGLNEPRDALGIAAWAVLADDEQRALVGADPTRWSTVFDEAIRWVAPIGMYSRQVTRDTELAGVRLPAGARLGICPISANRDESVWPDPHVFDIRREAKPHLAFSKGVHVCLGNWAAKAAVAEVGLPLLFARLEGLRVDPARATTVGGWVFRGMLSLPVTWDRAHAAEAVRRSPSTAGTEAGSGEVEAPREEPAAQLPASIAVVGAGAAGMYTIQALLAELPRAEIDVFDAQPTPYGLLRSGVAADHQGTKATSAQFEAVFSSERVRFHGNVAIGNGGVVGAVQRTDAIRDHLGTADTDRTDLELADLRSEFDAVVVATGCPEDRLLDVPGGRATGVHGAGAITRLLNGHPGAVLPADGLGATTTIVGHGNVALDLVRLLAADEATLEGSDVHDVHRARLTDGLRRIHVVGRSRTTDAKFDPAMIRELGLLRDVRFVLHGCDAQASEGRPDARIEALEDLAAGSPDAADARMTVEFWFGMTPVEVVAETGTVGGMLFSSASASASASAPAHASASAGLVEVPTDSVVTAIGFTAGPEALLDVTDEARGTGCVDTGLYVGGWFRTGSRGTIADQRPRAKELAVRIREDLVAAAMESARSGGECPFSGGSGASGVSGASAGGLGTDDVLTGCPVDLPAEAVDLAGWRRIDHVEKRSAPTGRCRSKIDDAELLLDIAHDTRIEVPEPVAASGTDLGLPGPVTIAFATESGNAELAAHLVRAAMPDDAEVEVLDLAEADRLDPSRFHFVLCSTYGDGEMPEAAGRLCSALGSGAATGEGLRYAMFGLSDRSYGSTYSRGSELLDEELRSHGGVRVGEFGRYDAGGSLGLDESVLTWAGAVALAVRAQASAGATASGCPFSADDIETSVGVG